MEEKVLQFYFNSKLISMSIQLYQLFIVTVVLAPVPSYVVARTRKIVILLHPSLYELIMFWESCKVRDSYRRVLRLCRLTPKKYVTMFKLKSCKIIFIGIEYKGLTKV